MGLCPSEDRVAVRAATVREAIAFGPADRQLDSRDRHFSKQSVHTIATERSGSLPYTPSQWGQTMAGSPGGGR